jgi:hypothetical protein
MNTAAESTNNGGGRSPTASPPCDPWRLTEDCRAVSPWCRLVAGKFREHEPQLVNCGQAGGLHLDIQLLAGQLERQDVVPETVADLLGNPLHSAGQIGAARVREPVPLVSHNQLFAQGSDAAALFLQSAVVDVSSAACPRAARRSVSELQHAAPIGFGSARHDLSEQGWVSLKSPLDFGGQGGLVICPAARSRVFRAVQD